MKIASIKCKRTENIINKPISKHNNTKSQGHNSEQSVNSEQKNQVKAVEQK